MTLNHKQQIIQISFDKIAELLNELLKNELFNIDIEFLDSIHSVANILRVCHQYLMEKFDDDISEELKTPMPFIFSHRGFNIVFDDTFEDGKDD